MAGYIRLPRDSEDSNDRRAIGVPADSPAKPRGIKPSTVLRYITSVWSFITLLIVSLGQSADPMPALRAALASSVLSIFLLILTWASVVQIRTISRLPVCEDCSARLAQPAPKANWFFRWFIFPGHGLVTMFTFATSIPVIVLGANQRYGRLVAGLVPGFAVAAGSIQLILSFAHLALWIAESWPNLRIEFQFDAETAGAHERTSAPSRGRVSHVEPRPEMQSAEA